MDNLLGEFLGTMVLLIFGGGVVANVVLKDTKGNGSGWIVITAGWAFAVLFGVFVAQAAGAPQADINPAVTFFKTLNGVYAPLQAIATMLAQTAGAIVGTVIVWLSYLPHWKVTEDKIAKLAVFSTVPAIRNLWANFLAEAIATCLLLIGIMAIFSKGVSGGVDFSAGIGPYMVGMLIWALGLSLGGTTGYALNPARDFGPRIAHAILPISNKGDSDWQYAWIPIMGPFSGAGIAFVVCKAIGIA